MKNFFEILEKYKILNPDRKIEGYSEEEIKKIEKLYDIEVKGDFKEFLKIAGRSSGGLLGDSELIFYNFFMKNNRGKMNTTLKEPKITYYVHDEVGNRRFIHLADSYDEFLDMIEIDKEEIEEREREIRESYFYGEQPLED